MFPSRRFAVAAVLLLVVTVACAPMVAAQQCRCRRAPELEIISPVAPELEACELRSPEQAVCICDDTEGDLLCDTLDIFVYFFTSSPLCEQAARTVAACPPLTSQVSALQFAPSDAAMMTGLAGWNVECVFTVGTQESLNAFGYAVTGILDGIGAVPQGDNVLLYVNSEIGAGLGFLMTMDSGASVRGSRVHKFVMDRVTRKVLDVELAYRTVYLEDGSVMVPGSEFEFNRFCSGAVVMAGQNGALDDMYITGEETSDGLAAIIEVSTDSIYVAPMIGRAGYENLVSLEQFGTDKIVYAVGDDREGVAMRLFVGQKGQQAPGPYNAPPFLVRNGFGYGVLLMWVADDGVRTPGEWLATGETTKQGKFVVVPNYNTATGSFLTMAELDAEADNVGAFRFSRPEDVSQDPADGTRFIMASTGRPSLFPEDSWGTLYTFDIDDASLQAALAGNVQSISEIVCSATIVYDGDEPANRDFGIRSPDNLDWSPTTGMVFVQEDRSVNEFCTISGEEASVWRFNPVSGATQRVMQINRNVPAGQVDSAPDDCANWESSGILDVTSLFATAPGEVLLVFDIQAHGIRFPADTYVQGGQLCFASGSL
ncbi:hypothetical protein FVE85_5130 [Porphyridium purpureum]|uniref:Uncharacterized protein n=1 Tax=Porphyridium purpureum TaxID=35688 RepID=A0A5J4Z2L4_PORPP|nr:hypothetical protein FVE85_5130 [Porphyridium purpureum]|eukprot:POR8361..scf295_1